MQQTNTSKTSENKYKKNNNNQISLALYAHNFRANTEGQISVQ